MVQGMSILWKRKSQMGGTKMKERYCPSKTARFEGDQECYYHGDLLVCPYCGQATRPVTDGEYKTAKKEHDVYTLREIGG